MIEAKSTFVIIGLNKGAVFW